MNEVRFDSMDGRSIRLSARQPADSDDIWAYEVTVETPTTKATAKVWDSGTELAKLFRDLADRWKGFDGTLEFNSLEGQFNLLCHHDNVGSVICLVTLRQPEPPSWDFRAEMAFGSGAHLERLASEVEAFVRDRS